MVISKKETLPFSLKFLISSAFSINVIANTSDETLENRNLYWPIKQSLLFSWDSLIQVYCHRLSKCRDIFPKYLKFATKRLDRGGGVVIWQVTVDTGEYKFCTSLAKSQNIVSNPKKTQTSHTTLPDLGSALWTLGNFLPDSRKDIMKGDEDLTLLEQTTQLTHIPSCYMLPSQSHWKNFLQG